MLPIYYKTHISTQKGKKLTNQYIPTTLKQIKAIQNLLKFIQTWPNAVINHIPKRISI